MPAVRKPVSTETAVQEEMAGGWTQSFARTRGRPERTATWSRRSWQKSRPGHCRAVGDSIPPGGNRMKILLWVLQVLLAVAFLAHGLMLLFPPQSVAGLLLASFTRGFWVFLGGAEIAAASGLTLPGTTRIQPWLVPAAAAGVMIVMISATIFHL